MNRQHGIITKQMENGMVKYHDVVNQFTEVFDPVEGFYARTGVLVSHNGRLVDTNVDPFMRDMPALIDIGIMGHCKNGLSGKCALSGVQCYQNGGETITPNMSFMQFKQIVEQTRGAVQQYALGGRGDVNQHEDFEDIVRYCRVNGIVPNYTTSGLDLTQEQVAITKKYCGAVAVSEYRQEHTRRAVKMFVDAGITTNIHYVLGNNSIDEAIEKLENGTFDEGINAVIFLLHKPVGAGKQENVLQMDDPRVHKFFKVVEDNASKLHHQIGFDSCNIPAIINLTTKINRESIDTCEGGRYSCYITADMKLLPCSFDNQDQRWAVDLNENTVYEAWHSPQFEDFRASFRNSCSDCPEWNECKGGCPIVPEIVLCDREEKSLFNVLR